MRFKPTKLTGIIMGEPDVIKDERGWFFESFRREWWEKMGIKTRFVQENHSRSCQNVLRGLHYQIEPRAMDKLVRVVAGQIFDVAVDIRRSSPTFGRWLGETLSAENKKQIFIPHGFAHGFVVLSEWAEVEYKCSDYYSPDYERGIRWNDPAMAVKWPVTTPILSAKDSAFPLLQDQKDLFV